MKDEKVPWICEGKNQHLKNTSIFKAKQSMFPRFKRSLHNLEDSVSNVQVDMLNM